MAAPNNVYSTKKVIAKKDTTTYNNFLAKFLINSPSTIGDEWGNGYFNASDDAATSRSKILDIFKLDGWIRVKQDSDDTFMGYVNTGSTNDSYHNANRVGIIKLSNGGVVKKVFNDGGLNRMGEAYLGVNTNEPKWANWINLAYEVRSAFYNETTDVGFSYRINGGAWSSTSFGIDPPDVKVLINSKYRQIDLTPTLEEGDTVGLRVYITNEEGTTYSEEYSFTAKETLAILTGVNLYSAPDGDAVGAVTLYMLETTATALESVTDVDTATGLYVFLSEYFTTENPTAGDIAADGWYVIGGIAPLPGGNIKVFKVEDGEIRRYAERVPNYPKIVFTCINNGEPDFPQYRGQATIQDDTNPATGFVQTVSTTVTIRYLNNAEEQLASYSKNITLTQGATTAYSAITSLPPEGTTKVQVTCAATESTLGMPKLEPVTSLPPA